MPKLREGLDRYQVEAEKIYKALKDREAHYKKEKPSYLGTRRWTDFTRRHILRLQRLGELRDAEKRTELPTDGAVYLHIHHIKENGHCDCGKV